MANRLARQTSPYLLQHADNPVDWYPWGDEALGRAKREDKPILLSIGYSACHWCHVMAHESFENEDIARFMNEHFVNVKVDREERPDLDDIYMQAVQALTGRGGWPLTMFLTPEGKPFFGGTYFPPADTHGMPGFPRVLEAVAQAYHHRRGEVDGAARQIETALSSGIRNGVIAEPLTRDILAQAYLTLRQSFDHENGGFGRAPKFPQPLALEFLLRYFHRTHDKAALDMVELTLNRMARGGIYDQIGGGFHRYATDSAWLVPHFEKMLYDNALLAQTYLHGYLVTGNSAYRAVTEGTLDYVLKEMTSPEGGFYSSQDADVEAVEGGYYLWTPEEIAEAVGEGHSRAVCSYFGVTDEGNFEGKNILHVAGDLPPEQTGIMGQAKLSLLKRREQRTRPGRDEKVLASWNGLMLSSLAEAACALDRADYLAAAVANGSFLLKALVADRYLKHTCKDGQAKIEGYLQDYGLVIDGLLALHQATFSGEWLRQAIKLAETMVEQFWDEGEGTLYDTGKRHEALFVRPRNPYDGALPSGPSAATLALLRLASLTDNERWGRIATQSLRLMNEAMRQQPLGFGHWLCALDFYVSTPKEIAIVGPRDAPAARELVRTLATTWLPNKVLAAHDPTDPTPVPGLRLLEGKQMVDNMPTVYVCQQHTCHTPVTDPDSLATQLREL